MGELILPGDKRFMSPSEVAEFHTYDDVDVNKDAHHHTLGNQPFQAAPGNHSNHKFHDLKNLPVWMTAENLATVIDGAINPGVGAGNWLVSGFYDTVGNANMPAGYVGWWHIIHKRHNNPTNNYAFQIAAQFDGTVAPHWRLISNDSPGGWTPL